MFAEWFPCYCLRLLINCAKKNQLKETRTELLYNVGHKSFEARGGLCGISLLFFWKTSLPEHGALWADYHVVVSLLWGHFVFKKRHPFSGRWELRDSKTTISVMNIECFCYIHKIGIDDTQECLIKTRTICTRGPSLQRKKHVKIHVGQQGFSNIAFVWLAAVVPNNQVWKNFVPCLHFLSSHNIEMTHVFEILLLFMKTRTHLFYISITSVAEDMVTQGSWASVAMVLN